MSFKIKILNKFIKFKWVSENDDIIRHTNYNEGLVYKAYLNPGYVKSVYL
jgi:hypothetical protein